MASHTSQSRQTLRAKHPITYANESLDVERMLRASYPERNFDRNQLLDSSIGLSPLCSADTMDLHVTTATDFHHSFLGLRLRQA